MVLQDIKCAVLGFVLRRKCFSANASQPKRDLASGKLAANQSVVRTSPDPVQGPNFEVRESLLLSALGNPAVKRRAYSVLKQITPDKWALQDLQMLEKAIAEESDWFDALLALNWYAHHFKPANYLEIGVRRGRSLTQVSAMSPKTVLHGFDLWMASYGDVPNPGPDFVASEVCKISPQARLQLFSGDSHKTVPAFFKKNPGTVFELIFVDGDHSAVGARKDLDTVVHRLAPGGMLVFDDINHPAHQDLNDVWNRFKSRHSDFLYLSTPYGVGTGLGFKAPFDGLEKIGLRPAG
jgi:hypothetical protein